MLILEQPGETHLPLNISRQDAVCLSLNNLGQLLIIAYHETGYNVLILEQPGTITHHCISRDRMHCVFS